MKSVSPATCAVQHPEALDGWHTDGHCGERRERQRHGHNVFHLVAMTDFYNGVKLVLYFMCKFNWKATSNLAAAAAARVYSADM